MTTTTGNFHNRKGGPDQMLATNSGLRMALIRNAIGQPGVAEIINKFLPLPGSAAATTEATTTAMTVEATSQPAADRLPDCGAPANG
jgi:hypothetical protein